MAETVTRTAAMHERRLQSIMVAMDRSAALERERDDARRQLSRVMEQIPGRLARKIESPQT